MTNKLPDCTPTGDVPADPGLAFPPLPVETEIYILPTGEIVVADLPRELAQELADQGLLPPQLSSTVASNGSDQ